MINEYEGLPVFQSDYIPDDTIVMLSDTHRGQGQLEAYKAIYGGTQSGRFQSSKPNIQNVPKFKGKDEEESVWLWEQCREAEKENDHKLCDDCNERFRCWTACRPERYHFLNPTFDVHYQQTKVLMNEMKKVGITIDEFKLAMAHVAASMHDENTLALIKATK